MWNWIKEHSAQITVVITALMLFLPGFAAYTDLKTAITRNTVQIGGLEKRVNRIADALPVVQSDVAFETIHRQILGALLFTNPVKTETGFRRWIHLIKDSEAKSYRLKSYQLVTSNETDLGGIYETLGITGAIEAKALSLNDMHKYAKLARKEKAFAPPSYDTKWSVVFHKTAPKEFNPAALPGLSEIRTRNLSPSDQDWPGMVSIISQERYFEH